MEKVIDASLLAAGQILILTGSPGSGKTTAAQQLAEMEGAPKVHLHADDFWHYIKYGAIAPYLPQAQAQNEVVIDVLAGTAARYAAGGYFVIIDGIIGPWFLESFEDLGTTVHYVVMLPALEDAIARCRLRGGKALADPDIIAELYRQFAEQDGFAHHFLPTTDLTPQQTVEQVLAAIRSEKYQL